MNKTSLRFWCMLGLACLPVGCCAEICLTEDPTPYAIRPAVSLVSELKAVDFVASSSVRDRNGQVGLMIEHLGSASRQASRYLYILADQSLQSDAKAKALHLAMALEGQADLCAKIKTPNTLEDEFVAFLAYSAWTNFTEKDSTVARNKVEADLHSRARGQIEQNLNFNVAMKAVEDNEAQILASLDPAYSKEKASSALKQAAAVVVKEQESRARAVWEKLKPADVYGLLVGTHTAAGQWNFEDGEMRSLAVDSVQYAGHCVLANLAIEVVGKSAGNRSLKVKTAFFVSRDGNISFFGVN